MAAVSEIFIDNETLSINKSQWGIFAVISIFYIGKSCYSLWLFVGLYVSGIRIQTGKYRLAVRFYCVIS